MLAPLILLVVTLVFTYLISQYMETLGRMGKDLHKPYEVALPESCGIGFVLPYLAFLLWVQEFFFSLTLGLISLIGLCDDFRGLSQTKKVLFSFLAGIPLIFSVESTTLNVVFFSTDLSYLYYLLVPLGIAAAANATNILAGFNGEAVGSGIIASTALAISLAVSGSDPVLILPFIAALAGFFVFNIYPSRVFPGDVGTLTIGAVIAGIGILGKVEIIAALCIVPQILEFFLKLRIRFSGKTYGPTKIENGILVPPPYLSVANLLTSHFRLTEKKLVLLIWIISAIFGVFAVFLSLFY
jgi:UDP-N-acetylglucosamine--dolichyl-phosphate N-acetylglucosaminephosphotransferase